MPPDPLAGAIPVAFDDRAAAVLATHLDQLADALAVMARRTGEAAAEARIDWRGFTRTWFDEQVGALLLGLRPGAGAARTGADQVRRATVVAAAVQTERNEVALRTRLAEVARLQASLATAPRSP